MKLRILFAIITSSIFFTEICNAQACCSAGTPIMSSLEVSATPANTWQFSLLYEYNYLNDVLSGSDKVKGIFNRLSQSVLFETSFGLNDYLAFTSILGLTQHTRELNSANIFNSKEKITTRGFSDVLFLIKYNVMPLNIFTQRQISIGVGVKIPTGKSDLTNNGFLLAADMQPGTGSWDGLIWAYFFQGFLPLSRFSLFINSTYRFNGTNNRFQLSGPDFKGYKFGNVFLLTTGTSYRTNSIFDFSISFRYRNVQDDFFSGSEIPNTGGHWVNIVPGININFESLSLRLAGQIPVFRDLNGIQLTTSHTISLSIFYNFSNKNENQ